MGLIVALEVRTPLHNIRPLCKAFSPPLIIVWSWIKLRQVKCNEVRCFRGTHPALPSSLSSFGFPLRTHSISSSSRSINPGTARDLVLGHLAKGGHSPEAPGLTGLRSWDLY